MCPVVPTHNILAVAAGAGKNKKNKTCGLCLVACEFKKNKRILRPSSLAGLSLTTETGAWITFAIQRQATSPPNSAELWLVIA